MAKKEKTQANIGFEKQIWDAACELWGHSFKICIKML